MSSPHTFWSNIKTLLKKWYGNFTKQELKKYLMLGLTFALILGCYWTLRALKDSIFGAIVVGYGQQIAGMGREKFLALAKVLSLIMLIPFIIGYSKLVDRYRKHRLLYVLGMIYIVGMAIWTLVFLHPTWGLGNTIACPWRISGWLWYVFVESFGSLFVALFWAFTVDITDQKSARRGFALIVLCGQFGGIFIPKFLTRLPNYFSTSSWIVVALCGGLIALTLVVVRCFVAVTPKEYLEGYKTSDEKTELHQEPGFLEGLKLLLSHWYLLGIFAVISFYEIILTIIDYNFKILAFATFSTETNALEFLGNYASAVNIVAFLCLALGINNIQRLLGIRTALALIPIIVGGAVATFFIYPQLEVLFYLLVGAKAINYALNNPSLKQLYIPTSEDARYKSQAWIEAFGARGAKATASFVNISRSIISIYPYMLMVASLSLGLAGLWFLIAIYLANTYTKAIKEQRLVC